MVVALKYRPKALFEDKFFDIVHFYTHIHSYKNFIYPPSSFCTFPVWIIKQVVWPC
jgi:hypothetical protein